MGGIFGSQVASSVSHDLVRTSFLYSESSSILQKLRECTARRKTLDQKLTLREPVLHVVSWTVPQRRMGRGKFSTFLQWNARLRKRYRWMGFLPKSQAQRIMLWSARGGTRGRLSVKMEERLVYYLCQGSYAGKKQPMVSMKRISR